MAVGSEPMLQKISLRDARGKVVSGSFEVRKGTITVTAPDGRTKTAVVAESLLNTRNPSEITFASVAQRDATEPKNYQWQELEAKSAAADADLGRGTQCQSR